jgi:hypothetical protein
MGIRDRPTSPRSPWQNAYAERLIGSIVRSDGNYVIVLGERHLRHILLSYNKVRTESIVEQGCAGAAPHSERWITFFAVRSWVDCTTSMSGFDLRQTQAVNAGRRPLRRRNSDLAKPVTRPRFSRSGNAQKHGAERISV